MVWDCFLFNDELDLLKLRLTELNEVVDRFVLVEMAFTHSMKPKPLYFEKHRSKFRKWLPRIEHVKVYDCPYSLDPYKRERHQRNAIQRGLRKAQENDIITICDVDEIPRANIYEHFKLNHCSSGIANLNMRLFFYWFNGYVNEPSKMAKILTGWMYNRSVPEEIRYFDLHDQPVDTLQDSGFHVSWLGDHSRALAKLNAGVFHKDAYIGGMRKELMNGQRPNPSNEIGGRKVVPIPVDKTDTHSWMKSFLDKYDYFYSKGLIADVGVEQKTTTPLALSCLSSCNEPQISGQVLLK